MHPAYSDTRFRCHVHPESWPEKFAILSAYATTGFTWSPERNASADRALEETLRQRGVWLHRLIGYSPDTQHAEPSWACNMELQEACTLGQEFAQDALYWVEQDQLFVLQCHAPDRRVFVGGFAERLDPP